MELLSTLSKHSNNSVAEMLPMQFEVVWGLKNGLESVFKKEAEMQKKEEEKAKSDVHIPSVPSPSSFKMPNISIPHY